MGFSVSGNRKHHSSLFQLKLNRFDSPLIGPHSKSDTSQTNQISDQGHLAHCWSRWCCLFTVQLVASSWVDVKVDQATVQIS